MKRLDAGDLIDCSGREADVATLLAACADFFVQHHLGVGQTPAIEHLMADLSPVQRTRTRLLGMQGADGQLIGLVVLVKDWQRARQWCLRVMLVHPDWRSQGIGSRLYETVVTWSKTQGAAAILIGVLAGNDGAQRFWPRHGFQVVRQTPHGSGDVQIELEHRFCDLPIARVVPPGRTLARQFHSLVPGQT
jgi:GNAT superfamily N-acetyltransferase